MKSWIELQEEEYRKSFLTSLEDAVFSGSRTKI